MTRWDCDVRLWRGVPCSFPALHGWPVSAFDVVQSSTASLRYIFCGACYQWVPEFTMHHSCLLSTPSHVDLIRATDNKTATDTTDATDNATDNETATDDDNNSLDEKPRPSVYVVETDEHEDVHMCGICTQPMRLDFVHDVEAWVFMDCVEHEGVPVHEICRDCVYG